MDAAHAWTDEQIEALQKDFAKTYRQAAREMRSKILSQMREFDRDNKEWKELVRHDPKAKAQYRAWLKSKAADRKWIRAMAMALAQDAARADQIAADHIYDAIPYVFAENANRAAFAIQEGISRDIGEFELYDADTVRNLIANSPDLLPPIPQPEHKKGKDVSWNSRRFANEITQSVLQGESIPDASKRLMRVLHMDERAAIRSARTALTGAENSGRIHSYRRAKELGIDLEQQWIATLDERTRTEHRMLDGQHVPVGEKFKVPGVEIEFPGDPTAKPEMVWNCRCTLVAWFSDVQDPERWSRLPEGMTYEEWKSGKATKKEKDDGTK